MKLPRLGPVVLTLVIFSVILYVFRNEISVDRFLTRIAGADIYHLTLSAVCFAVSIAGASARYRFVIKRAIGTDVSFNYIFLLSNFSYACGYLAPMSVATELLRIGFTKQYLKVGYLQSMRLVIIDKLLGLAGVALFSLLFFPLKLLYGINRELVLAECAAIFVLGGCAVALTSVGGWTWARSPILKKYLGHLEEEWRFVRGHFSDLRDIGRLLVYTLLAIGGFGLGTVFVAQAVHFEVTPVVVFVLSPTILLAQNAPIFYAGFGAREAVLLIALHDLALADPNVVLSFSVMVGLMLLVATVLPSIVFVLWALHGISSKEADRGSDSSSP